MPRWRLGSELRHYREQAGYNASQVADELEYSESKVRKIEAGRVPVKPADLSAFVKLYEINETDHERLEGYRRLGTQRGWWGKYPLVRHESAVFFGVESSARTIRTYEPYCVPGLLQTEAYVRALARGWGYDDEHGAQLAAVRMERQKLIFANGPSLRVVLDEGVLHRTLGDPAMLREQLAALLEPPPDCLIQVLPHGVDAHAGTVGNLSVYEFDGDLHSPIAVSESALGVLYVEDEQVTTLSNVLMNLVALALPPSESDTLIRARMKAVRGRK